MPDSATEPIGIGEPETPDRDGAFPRLDDEQSGPIPRAGHGERGRSGEVLFAAGDEGSDFFVIESGAVAIVQGRRGEPGDRRPRPASLPGRAQLLTGQRLYLSAVVATPGEVIQVPVEKLRQIVAEDKPLSDIILGAFIARRSILIDAGTGIKLIGSRFSPDPGACASSWSATACPTSGSISRTTRRPTRC